MKNVYFPKFVIVFIGVFIWVTASAQNFHLVKDMNPFTDSDPSNYRPEISANRPYAMVNGTAYFSANDGINGIGLWRSDGTTAGTMLVKALVPDTSATPCVNNITAYNNGVIFSVSVPAGNQIWISDGTNKGTKKLKDLPFTTFLSTPEQFTAVNGNIYFVNSYNLYEDQLWKTDGTDTGTTIIADFFTNNFNFGYGIFSLTNFEGTLFFSATTNLGGGIWKSDGTASGTTPIKNFTSSQSTIPLVVLNGNLYFSAYQYTSSRLWKTDGSASGTTAINGSIEFNDPFWQANFQVMQNAIYFSYSNSLYTYSPKNSDAGVQLVTNAGIATNAFSISNLTSCNDSILFFNTNDSLNNQQLWVSNGTASGTNPIKSVPINSNTVFANLYSANSKIFFSCNADSTGYEVWQSNGTETGTKIIKDIRPGIYNSNPSSFTVIGSSVVFSATDGTAGYELWKTDGTEGGTLLIKDINKTTTADANPQLWYQQSQQVANADQLFLGAYDDPNVYNYSFGNLLWRTDGTSSGTYILKNVVPGTLLANFKKNNYFFGGSVNDGTPLWKSDGTTKGTSLVENFIDSITPANIIDAPYPISMAAGDSLLFMQIRDNSNSEDGLWVSDGSSPAKLLKKYYLSAGSSGSTIPLLYLVGNIVLFGTEVGYDRGIELWKSDGTVAGTQMIKPITPAEQYTNFTATVYNNKLHFAANNGTGTYLWVSDGTSAGTNVLKNVQVDTYVAFTENNGKLYFAASDGTHGTELWVTDGTAAGTQMVKDIYPGSKSSNMYNVVDVNGVLFFTADDGVHGTELWKSNGTDSGTVLVKDITLGEQGSNFNYLVNGNGKLYFTVNNLLWQSNGTSIGTEPVEDANLIDLKNIQGIIAVGDKLYFSGYTYAYGQELYVGQANSTLPVTLLSFTGQWAKKDAQLTWVTTNELNNNHFNIQRSLTGTGFATVGSVKADGDATTRHTYNYTDVNAAGLGSNSVYYRLQQVDNNGKFNYTNIVRLNVAANNLIAIAPNPAQKTANIISGTDILGAEIVLTDMGGHIVYATKQNLTAGTPTPLNISGLAAGVYNVTVQSANNVKQQVKLVVR